jgi:hypothetical protein
MKEREHTIPAEARDRLAEAAEHLVQLYDAQGKPDQAAHWREVLARESEPATRDDDDVNP